MLLFIIKIKLFSSKYQFFGYYDNYEYYLQTGINRRNALPWGGGSSIFIDVNYVPRIDVISNVMHIYNHIIKVYIIDLYL